MDGTDLDATLSALADPIRRRIVERLGKGETTVSDLAAPFDVSLPAISRHLGVLERAGLITRERHAQWRTCRLVPERLAEVRSWLGGIQPYWDERFSALEAHLAAQLVAEGLRRTEPDPTADATPADNRTTTEEQS